MGVDIRLVERGKARLEQIATNGSVEELFQAMRSVVPAVQAGLYSSVRPNALHAVVNHTLHLPHGMLEEWMTSSPETFEMSLKRLFFANEGDTWGAHEMDPRVRAELTVLQDFGRFGLGDAIGYKVMRQKSVEEHVLFALLTDRGVSFDEDSRALLTKLNPFVKTAVNLMRVPLVAGTWIFDQVIREEKLGYVCTTRSGIVLESNRRAHELIDVYEKGSDPKRHKLSAFCAKAARFSAHGTFQLHHGGGQLHVTQHELRKGSHALDQDIVLFVLAELSPPLDLTLLKGLSFTERRVVYHLVTTAITAKEIAQLEGPSHRTMETHIQNIYKKLGVRSRVELIAMLTRPN